MFVGYNWSDVNIVKDKRKITTLRDTGRFVGYWGKCITETTLEITIREVGFYNKEVVGWKNVFNL